jgi:hypothetical protein
MGDLAESFSRNRSNQGRVQDFGALGRKFMRSEAGEVGQDIENLWFIPAAEPAVKAKPFSDDVRGLLSHAGTHPLCGQIEVGRTGQSSAGRSQKGNVSQAPHDFSVQQSVVVLQHTFKGQGARRVLPYHRRIPDKVVAIQTLAKA